MLRFTSRAARIGKLPSPYGLITRRWKTTTSSSRSFSRTLLWGTGGLAAAATGFYFSNNAAIETPSSTVAVSHIKEVVSEEDISIVSPVKVLDLQAANKKLREDAHSFAFESKDGIKGRVDVVRVSSNDPVEDEWAVSAGKGVGGSNTVFAGVYDGHAGGATSATLKATLIPYVSTALNRLARSAPGEVIDTAIKDAFVHLDYRIFDIAKVACEAGHDPGSAEVVSALMPAAHGSCALLAVYDPHASILRTAVTGDSRAVLGSWSATTGMFSADVLSIDQTGFNQDEVRRLDREHPGEIGELIDTKEGRLVGLMVTRAFGDNRLKWPNDLLKLSQSHYHGFGPLAKNKTPPYLTARPEITTRRVQTQDFAILASDGLWDVMSSDDAVECVSRWLVARNAGKSEPVHEIKAVGKAAGKLDDKGWLTSSITPELFAIEDLDNAAVCLAKNALGGKRRSMFCGAMTVPPPIRRNVRDDITVQVIFFKDPSI